MLRLLRIITFLAGASVSCAVAQDSRGTVSGRVADPGGSAVSGVNVRIANTSTGAQLEAKSNDAGNFTILFVLPGFYDLTAELSGFKRLERKNVEVRVNDSVTLDLGLTIGDVAESVEVSGAAPPLDISTVSLGQVYEKRRLVDLPIQSGNPAELAKTAPGSVSISSLGIQKAAFNNGLSQIVTNGNTTYANEFLIDGVPNTFAEGSIPRIAFSPPQAAIGEFKSQTTSYDASLGHSPGAVINMITAGGTNQYHGELHEFWGGSALDTSTLFQNRAGLAKPAYSDNRYGGSIGGPLWLPRYNGRNKTFLFYAYEGNKWKTPNVTVTSVPTLAEKAGDFSSLLKLSPQYQIYDPLTTASLNNGHYSRQPFPGNIIPPTRLNPVALNIAKYWPSPNSPGLADGTSNYTTQSTSTTEDYHVDFFRIDHNFSDRNRVFVRLDYDWWNESQNNYFSNISTGVVNGRINRGLAFDEVFVMNASTVLNVRYGLTDQEHTEQSRSRGFDLSSLGFSPNTVSLFSKNLAAFPILTVAGFQGFGNFVVGDGANTSFVHDINASLSTLKGNHMLRYGADFRLYRAFQLRLPYGVAPAFIPTTTYTRGPQDSSPPAARGQELASFLLGISDGVVQQNASYATQDTFFAGFVQDEWKVRPKLTLTIGLRLEHESPVSERFDRAVNGFDFNAANPISAQAIANYARNPIPEVPVANFKVLGGLTFAGGAKGHSLWSGQAVNVMPRIGIAYALNSKTVIRAGYGIFYDTIGTNRTPAIQTGFTSSTPMIPSYDNGITYASNIANPFPNGLLAPLGAAGGLATNLGQSLSFYPNQRVQPYSQRWSFGFQRELKFGFVLDSSYVGNRGTQLQIARELNYTNPAYLSTTGSRDANTINFLSQQFPNPFFGLNSVYPQNISRANLLTRYPEFGSILETLPVGYSIYHSLQTQLQKRMANGFTINVGYTWSKLMDATAFLNPGDPTSWYGISTLDRPHRVVASSLWEVPIGRGRALAPNMPKWLNYVVGGLDINALVVRQSGAPLEFGNVLFNGDIKSIELPKDQRSVDNWFNTAGFERAGAKQLASNLRTFPLRFSGVRGDGQARWDFTAQKHIPIREKVQLTLRADIFNALNHANLQTINVSPTSSAFGTVTSLNGGPRQIQVSAKVTF